MLEGTLRSRVILRSWSKLLSDLLSEGAACDRISRLLSVVETLLLASSEFRCMFASKFLSLVLERSGAVTGLLSLSALLVTDVFSLVRPFRSEERWSRSFDRLPSFRPALFP